MPAGPADLQAALVQPEQAAPGQGVRQRQPRRVVDLAGPRRQRLLSRSARLVVSRQMMSASSRLSLFHLAQQLHSSGSCWRQYEKRGSRRELDVLHHHDPGLQGTGDGAGLADEPQRRPPEITIAVTSGQPGRAGTGRSWCLAGSRGRRAAARPRCGLVEVAVPGVRRPRRSSSIALSGRAADPPARAGLSALAMDPSRRRWLTAADPARMPRGDAGRPSPWLAAARLRHGNRCRARATGGSAAARWAARWACRPDSDRRSSSCRGPDAGSRPRLCPPGRGHASAADPGLRAER